MDQTHLTEQPQELSQFYQEVILDHFKHPRFKGRMTDCEMCQQGNNPLCGDKISLYCKMTSQESGLCLQVCFEGSGCSISQASASIMCEIVHNKNVHEAKNAIKHAETIYTGKYNLNSQFIESDIEALHGVGQFPARIKCAALAWKTLECLIDENFDSKGLPRIKPCKKHLSGQKREKKLKIVSTEL